MRHIRISLASLILSLALPSFGSDPASIPMRPGLWRIDSRSEILGSGQPPSATTLQRCFNAADLRESTAAHPPKPGCEITDYRTTGRKASWGIRCGGAERVSGTGSLEFEGAEAYRGQARMTVERTGTAPSTIDVQYQAQRLGDCPGDR